MRQNVVEFAVVRTDVAQVGREQGNVFETQRRDRAASGGNGLIRQVQAGETAFGERIGHGDEVAAVSAADLEHAAIRHRSGGHAEERAYRRQAVGMRREPGHGVVRYFVVGVVGHRSNYGRFEPSPNTMSDGLTWWRAHHSRYRRA